MKQLKFNITVDYNPETDSVENYKVVLEGVENKTKSTKKYKKEATTYDVTLCENKIIFSQETLNTIGAEEGDRINIEYDKIDNKLIPIIYKDENKGNKLTKSNTIAFKGKQNEMLSQYGDHFTIEFYKDKYYKLNGSNNTVIATTVEEAVKNIDLDIEILKDTNYTIDKIETYEL